MQESKKNSEKRESTQEILHMLNQKKQLIEERDKFSNVYIYSKDKNQKQDRIQTNSRDNRRKSRIDYTNDKVSKEIFEKEKKKLKHLSFTELDDSNHTLNKKKIEEKQKKKPLISEFLVSQSKFSSKQKRRSDLTQRQPLRRGYGRDQTQLQILNPFLQKINRIEEKETTVEDKEKTAYLDFTLQDIQLIEETRELNQKYLEQEIEEYNKKQKLQKFVSINERAGKNWSKIKNQVFSFNKMKNVMASIKTFGTNSKAFADLNKTQIEQLKKEIKERDGLHLKEKEKEGMFDINGMYLKVWNFITIFIFLYTGYYTTVKVFFYDRHETWTEFFFEKIVDILIFISIINQFYTPMQNKPHKDFIYNKKFISKKYLKSWFFFDLFSIFPGEIFQFFSDKPLHLGDGIIYLPYYNDILKIILLPKTYTQFRCNLLDIKSLHLGTAHQRLYTFLVNVILTAHIVGCIWYFCARVYDFGPETWVYEYDMLHKSKGDLYIVSIYWTISTLATVGFGDISANNNLERVVSLIWMCIGVVSYSYTVGSLSTMMLEFNYKTYRIQQSQYIFDEFIKFTDLPVSFRHKIRNALKFTNQRAILDDTEKEEFFEDIPNQLQIRLANNMFEEINRHIPFFNQVSDGFRSDIISYLTPMELKRKEMVYNKNSYPNQIYFMMKGRVNFIVGKQNACFKTFVGGSYFGEIEVLYNLPRMFSVRCEEDCSFLTVDKNFYLFLLQKYPDIRKKVKILAKQRQQYMFQSLTQIDKFLQIDPSSVFWMKKQESYKQIVQKARNNLRLRAKTIEICQSIPQQLNEFLKNEQSNKQNFQAQTQKELISKDDMKNESIKNIQLLKQQYKNDQYHQPSSLPVRNYFLTVDEKQQQQRRRSTRLFMEINNQNQQNKQLASKNQLIDRINQLEMGRIRRIEPQQSENNILEVKKKFEQDKNKLSLSIIDENQRIKLFHVYQEEFEDNNNKQESVEQEDINKDKIQNDQNETQDQSKTKNNSCKQQKKFNLTSKFNFQNTMEDIDAINNKLNHNNNNDNNNNDNNYGDNKIKVENNVEYKNNQNQTESNNNNINNNKNEENQIQKNYKQIENNEKSLKNDEGSTSNNSRKDDNENKVIIGDIQKQESEEIKISDFIKKNESSNNIDDNKSNTLSQIILNNSQKQLFEDNSNLINKNEIILAQNSSENLQDSNSLKISTPSRNDVQVFNKFQQLNKIGSIYQEPLKRQDTTDTQITDTPHNDNDQNNLMQFSNFRQQQQHTTNRRKSQIYMGQQFQNMKSYNNISNFKYNSNNNNDNNDNIELKTIKSEQNDDDSTILEMASSRSYSEQNLSQQNIDQIRGSVPKRDQKKKLSKFSPFFNKKINSSKKSQGSTKKLQKKKKKLQKTKSSYQKDTECLNIIDDIQILDKKIDKLSNLHQSLSEKMQKIANIALKIQENQKDLEEQNLRKSQLLQQNNKSLANKFGMAFQRPKQMTQMSNIQQKKLKSPTNYNGSQKQILSQDQDLSDFSEEDFITTSQAIFSPKSENVMQNQALFMKDSIKQQKQMQKKKNQNNK